MKLIVGLGNPGTEYEGTRHNAGFVALDMLAEAWGAPAFSLEKKLKSLVTKVLHNGETFVLAKPQTFMNLSGEAVRALLDFYKLDPEQDLIVTYDDIDLLLGDIRTTGTSSGGHNGMKSLFQHVGTQNVARVRIGIDAPSRPEQMDTADYVLQKFSEEERKTLETTLHNGIMMLG